MDRAQDKNPAIRFAQRRLENLKFFSRSYPSLYSHFKDLNLRRAEVVILPDKDEVDLHLDGCSQYNGKGRAFAAQEVELFRSNFARNNKLKSLPPPWPGDYRHPRFAHKAVDQVVRLSPLKQSDFAGYPIADFYPLVVFLGVGLGYQIEQLVKQHDVENAIILEPDTEVFAASLFTIDWERVCSNFAKKGRSLNFLLGVRADEETLWPNLMTQLMPYCPVFPMMTLFLNHRNDSEMAKAAERLNKEVITSLTAWGHYDDEIRQLNNALHAFHEGVPAIPPAGSINSDMPILVVGSGPSLDNRLSDIRAVRNDVLVVSAGTGLRALIENDILPDFHVELESDYFMYRLISSHNPEKLKKVRIIAASQICPLIWGLFGDSRLYFKLENPIAGLFGREEQTIKGGTPTCTNAALALSTQLGLRNIFLFGTDYGFQKHEKHHASQSVYGKNDDDSLNERLETRIRRNFIADKTFAVEGVDGKSINTTPVFFSAKRKVEILIQDARALTPETRFHNCSDGARIEGAKWLDSKTFLSAVEKTGSTAERSRILALLFSPDAPRVSTVEVNAKLREMEEQLKRLSAYTKQLFKDNRMRGKKDITRFVSNMSRYLETKLANESPSFYFFMRGTVRHFLATGFSHAMGLANDSQVRDFLKDWQAGFLQCLDALPKHFHKVTYKEYRLTADPWVTQSIEDPEEDVA